MKTDQERVQQLVAVVDWLNEIDAWILGDVEVAVEEGDLTGLQLFKRERDVVTNLRGMAHGELVTLKRAEKKDAQRKLDEWRQAVGK